MIIWAWVLAAGAGAVVSAWNAWDSWLDLRALGELKNGRRIIAFGWLRRDVIRLAIQSSWFLLGVPALGADPRPTLALFVLVATNVLLLVSTVLDARDRLALSRVIGPS